MERINKKERYRETEREKRERWRHKQREKSLRTVWS